MTIWHPSMTFDVRHPGKEAYESHSRAVANLRAGLGGNNSDIIQGLVSLLQDSGKCLSAGMAIVARISIRDFGELVIPVVDLHATSAEPWTGLHIPIFPATAGPGKRDVGHVVFRNLDSQEAFPGGEPSLLDAVTDHEVSHVRQELEGRHVDLLTDEDLRLCEGFPCLLPMRAASGRLSRDVACGLAARYLHQKVKSEMEAMIQADVPAFAVAFRGRDSELAEQLLLLECAVLRDVVLTVGRCFVDVYRLPWRQVVGMIADALDALPASAAPDSATGHAPRLVGPRTIFESVDLFRGVITNRGLPPSAFAQFAPVRAAPAGEVGRQGTGPALS